jgi:hypothetical protein
MSLVIGLYPRPVLDRINPSVEALLDHVDAESDWVEPSVPSPPAEVGEAEGSETSDHSSDEAETSTDEHSIGSLDTTVTGGVK